MSKIQNYSNHRHLVPPFHFVTLGALLVLMAGSVVALVRNTSGRLIPGLLLLGSIIIILVALYCRSFALRAQDRAIRAEESLRYFILTGKRISNKLAMSQFIALRFASDEEFIPLTQKAVEENLSNKEIKKMIKNWRPDFNRA